MQSREEIMKMHSLAKYCSILAVILTVLCSGPALAQTPLTDLSQGQVGVIYFSSVTTTSYGDLVSHTGSYNTAAVVKGALSLPSPVAGKVPAVVIAHTCGGVSSAETAYAQFMNSHGIAAFVLDSFSPRGITQTCTGTSSPNGSAPAADALAALKLLATHPSIDPNRIAVFGRSYGGWAVYTTAMEEVRRSIIDTSLKFAAHIGFYPSGCNIRVWSANVTRAPMLILLGALDDWTPAADCMDFDIQLRAVGMPIRTIVYPNASHAFDNTSYPTANYDASRGSSATCRGSYRTDTGQTSRYDTGQVLDLTDWNIYRSACGTHGATMAYSADATNSAVNDTEIFLAKTLGITGVSLPTSQPDRIFDWAEATFPAYLSPAGSASQTAIGYYYRYYAQTNIYVGIMNGAVFYYAPGTSASIINLGDQASYFNSASQAGY